MSAVYETYDGTHDIPRTIGGTLWVAQTFTPSTSHVIDKVSLRISQGAAADGSTGTIAIQGVDVSNHPDGTDLCTVTFTDTDLPTIGDYTTWTDFVLSSVTSLTAGIRYAILIKVPNGGASEHVVLSGIATGTYTGGTYEVSTNSGSSWDAYAADYFFKEWGAAALDAATIVSYSRCLVAVGLNCVYHDKATAGTMAELTAATNEIDTVTKMCNIAEAYGKVFIVNENNLKVVDFVNTKIDLGSGNELTSPPGHGDVLTQDTSDAIMVVDFVDSTKRYIYGRTTSSDVFDTTHTVSSSDTVGTMDGATFTPSVVTEPTTIPHWYSWTTFPDTINSDGVTVDYGDLPSKATLVCLWRGRVMVSGDLTDPHQWYALREEDPFDALYEANDAQSPVAGQNAEAGKIGDVVVALCPINRDYFVFGCVNSMHLLTGNPAEGGSLDPLCNYTGIYGPQSWCIDGEGNLWFWGVDGLYKANLPSEKPVCISKQSLPKLVADEAVNPDTHKIVLHYDSKHRGIQVFITQIADGTNSNYWYDLQTEGFFPESYPEECAIHSVFFYSAEDSAYRGSIYGCADGYLRFFDPSVKDDVLGDDTVEAIDSYVTFGPLQIANDPKFEGKITGLNCITAGGAASGSQSDSNDIQCRLFLAKSAEEVIEQLSANSAPRLTKTITAPGRQRSSIVTKLRGVYAGIRLGNSTEGETWGFEMLLVDGKKSGRLK